MTRKNTPATFWSRVDKSGGPDACWPWTGRRKPALRGMTEGHGCYDYEGTWAYAHRYAWFLTYGSWPVPNANHTCDSPPCCNVRHMYEGTQQQNITDRDARHRRNVAGERHPRALFNADQVQAIRDLAATGWTATDIARETGFRQDTIYKIAVGKSYR